MKQQVEPKPRKLWSLGRFHLNWLSFYPERKTADAICTSWLEFGIEFPNDKGPAIYYFAFGRLVFLISKRVTSLRKPEVAMAKVLEFKRK